MKITFFSTVLTFIIFCQLSMNAQSNYTEVYPNHRISIEYERLNIKTFSNKYHGNILDYTYTKEDGTTIQAKSYKRGSNIEIFERPPFPAIHIIYKEFYPNGSLKQKGVLLPQQLKIGKWLDLDQRGEGIITDYETGRTAYGYNDVLVYLENVGCYNKTDGNNWKCTFWYSPDTLTWGVRVDKNGQQYKMYTFDSNGQNSVIENDLTPNRKSVSSNTFYPKK